MRLSRLSIMAVTVLLAASVSLGAADNKKCLPVNLSKEQLAFKGGEKLVFTIHYKFGFGPRFPFLSPSRTQLRARAAPSRSRCRERIHQSISLTVTEKTVTDGHVDCDISELGNVVIHGSCGTG